MRFATMNCRRSKGVNTRRVQEPLRGKRSALRRMESRKKSGALRGLSLRFTLARSATSISHEPILLSLPMDS